MKEAKRQSFGWLDLPVYDDNRYLCRIDFVDRHPQKVDVTSTDKPTCTAGTTIRNDNQKHIAQNFLMMETCTKDLRWIIFYHHSQKSAITM